MKQSFGDMLTLFDNDNSKLLKQGYYGVEREAQRITPDGNLALTSHPSVFGNKMRNPRITTDFSESQIEMITPPRRTVEGVIHELGLIHDEVTRGIGEELLWPFSMPPRLPEEDNIPIAIFPNTEYGRFLNTYRSGLAIRYGKKMQMISGLHYNFSFSQSMLEYLYSVYGNGEIKREFTDELYFGVIRNFLRYRWLLIYLFGASPLCDQTYDTVIYKELSQIKNCCPHIAEKFSRMNEYATSLRVSRFGYTDTLDPKENIYFNSMDEYIWKLDHLISTKCDKYSKLGVFKNGYQLQLNDNILQKESEFYSTIRPKQNLHKGETQLSAIKERGVKYIEVRILDINPLKRLGISVEQLCFMQVFMLFCLFEYSELIDEETFIQISSNHHLVSLLGRDKALKLRKYGVGDIPLRMWGEEIFLKLQVIAKLLDRTSGDGRYNRSVESEYRKLSDISSLPSEKIYRKISGPEMDYLKYGIALANQYRTIEGRNDDGRKQIQTA